MEKVKTNAFNDVLYIKYCKRAPSETAADSSALVVSRSQDKKTITRLRAELNKTAFKYKAVFNSSHTYYVILNKQLAIVDFNLAYAELMTNVSDKPLQTGENIASYLSGKVKEEVLDYCARVLAGETLIVERSIMLRNNQYTWWMIEYLPAYDAMNNIAGVVFNVIDITHRKNHELKIEMQNSKLREISLMQSHEVRGPLCTMMGLMELVKIDGVIDETGYLGYMEAAMHQLDKAIRGIVECANKE